MSVRGQQRARCGPHQRSAARTSPSESAFAVHHHHHRRLLKTYLKMTRLYTKGRVLGYTRGKRNQKPTSSLIQLEGVANKQETSFYLGKRVAYVYRAERAIKGSKVRIIWGKVTRPHGNSGVVRARFSTNLPPKSFGASCRIMLYPSNI
ncbi:hypothetical protein O181_096727 [Austropuccinia psidii MF-1]|uniref:Uncharacterized protein n=1 Tax=Austropuccinia psidii MF-1 TaxID=1389203 RepID=A0A9Q3J7V3_9BASI|nr:hypothetical protein [Austropuccinia psidii MF-1]